MMMFAQIPGRSYRKINEDFRKLAKKKQSWKIEDEEYSELTKICIRQYSLKIGGKYSEENWANPFFPVFGSLFTSKSEMHFKVWYRCVLC